MARIINYNVNPDKNMESKNISNTWSSDDYVTSGVSCCFSPKCWSKSLPSTMWCWSLICLVWYIGMVGPHGCAWSVSPGGSIICSMSSCCTSFCNQFTVKTLDGGGSNNRSTVGRPSKLTFLCPWGFYVAWCIISWADASFHFVETVWLRRMRIPLLWFQVSSHDWPSCWDEMTLNRGFR